MTIVEFLEAQFAADEALAQEASPGPWAFDEVYGWAISGPDGMDVVNGSRWGGAASAFTKDEDALHIARHDPARVLREVAAKRAILATWRLNAPPYGSSYQQEIHETIENDVLPHLASVYSDHPDFDPSWVLGSDVSAH